MSVAHIHDQLIQHDKRIIKVEINQDSHEKVCALRYQTILDKIDSNKKDYEVVQTKLEAQSVRLDGVDKTLASWGLAFKVFLWFMGVLVGIPTFILTCLKIIQTIKDML